MKKIICFTLCLALAGALAAADDAAAPAEAKFFAALSVSGITPADGDFKEIYGSWVVCPELLAGLKFGKGLFAYAGFGMFSKSGLTPELQSPAETRQNIVSLGAGIQRKTGKDLEILGGIGIVRYGYREEALDEVITGSAVGLRLDGALLYPLGRRLAVGLILGYLYGTDKVEDVSVKLGGLKAGLLLLVKI